MIQINGSKKSDESSVPMFMGIYLVTADKVASSRALLQVAFCI